MLQRRALRWIPSEMQRKEGEKRERRKITVGLFNILQEGLQERVRVGSKGCDPLQWIQAEAK